MKTIKIYILSLFTFVCLSQCSKDTTESCDVSQNITFEKFGQSSGLSLDITGSGDRVNTVIKNQDDYERYVTTNSTRPLVDFKKNVIVCGKYFPNSCATLVNQEIEGNCTQLVYTVTIQKQLCSAAVPVNHFILIPINFANADITFNYNIL